MASIFTNKCFKVGQFCCLAFALLLGVGCSSEVKMDQRLVDTFVELRLADMSFGETLPWQDFTVRMSLKNRAIPVSNIWKKSL